MEIPKTMRAMLLTERRKPLKMAEVAIPEPKAGQVLIKVHTCGVCRTDLHVLDGDLTEPKLPLILGHQIIGTVVDMGAGVDRFSLGQRIGVPWLGYTDGTCRYCLRGQENLCDHPEFTGYTLDGGYAEYATADQRYCFAVAEIYNDIDAAPLLCAGLIGYRTYRLAGDTWNGWESTDSVRPDTSSPRWQHMRVSACTLSPGRVILPRRNLPVA